MPLVLRCQGVEIDLVDHAASSMVFTFAVLFTDAGGQESTDVTIEFEIRSKKRDLRSAVKVCMGFWACGLQVTRSCR